MLYESPNFRLEANDLIATLWLDLRARADHSLTLPLINEFTLLVDRIAQLKFLDAVVIRSGKADLFCRGLDSESWQSLMTPNEVAAAVLRGQELTRKISELPMPSLALVEGECETGGIEIALACSTVVAVNKSSVGFRPGFLERGLIPSWGGTKRLSERLGTAAARSWLTDDRRLDASLAANLGLVDILLPEAGVDIALNQLTDRIGSSRSIKPGMITRIVRTFRRGVTIRPTRILSTTLADAFDQIFATQGLSLTESNVVERRCMCQLLVEDFGTRQMLEFANETEVFQIKDGGGRAFRRISHLGSSVEQCAVAETLLTRGIAVESLTEKAEWARSKIEKPAGGTPEVLLVPGEDPEEIRRKLAVMAGRLNARTVIALTGNSVTVNEVSQGMPHSAMIVGLHRPRWSVTPGLIEVSSGPRTSEEVICRIESWLVGIKCNPVRVTDRPGHVANTLFLAFLAEAVSLVADGFSPVEVDRLALQMGFAKAPLEWCDEIGFEELSTITAQLQLARRDNFAKSLLFHQFRPYRWNGRSTGEGFYRYGFRKRENELARMALWQDNERTNGAFYINDLAAGLTEAGDRLIYRVINEAAFLAESASVEVNKNTDRAAVLTMGWPRSLSGPLRLTDNTGLLRIVNRLHELRLRHGERFRPAPELLRRTEHGLRFTESTGHREHMFAPRQRMAG